MDRTTNYFDAWLKAQEAAVGTLAETARRYQQACLGLGGNGGTAPGMGAFPGAYAAWTTAVTNALCQGGGADPGLLRETLSKTLAGSNAYLKLYELWLPLARALQQRGGTASAQDLFDPAKYREVLDGVFGFNPQAMAQLAEQSGKLLEAFAGSSQGFLKPWLEASSGSLGAFPQLLEGHPESFMRAFHALYRAFDDTVGRAFHVPAVGKDREKIELLLRSLDDLSVYLARNTEYQHMMYVTGVAAFEKLIASVAEMVGQRKEPKTFDEFFSLWINVNEKAFFALFRTEDFARRQGQVLQAALQVRQGYFKLAELYLYDLPIALRSEMDDLYRTIYDLKRTVKRLERRLGEERA